MPFRIFNIFRLVLWLILNVCGSCSVLSAFENEIVWVTSKGAKLKAAPSGVSQPITDLALGTKLYVIHSEKKWLRVFNDQGHNGWIYRGKVSSQPYAPDVPDHKLKPDVKLGSPGDSTITGEQIYSARSMRETPSDPLIGPKEGLSEVTMEYIKFKGISDEMTHILLDVIQMEITEADIESFQKEACLGEYAQ